jgi:3-isopropylmalate/(R)-2-methylmalate dehydratase small subunit
MKPFLNLTAVAAPLPEANIDTDIIFPARFLLLLDKKGLGAHLFNERRAKMANRNARFVLDQPPFDHAEILVAGADFGVGSSREHAVWALADFGIRCVIAPSFGEIFYANCFKNGVLPVVLPQRDTDALMSEAQQGKQLSVDLEAQYVRLGDGRAMAFEIDAHRKRALLLGLDEIGAVLEDDADDIAAFEANQRNASPWLYLTPAELSCFGDLETPGETGAAATL